MTPDRSSQNADLPPRTGPSHSTSGVREEVGKVWPVLAVSPSERIHAAARLMADQHPDPHLAGNRFLQAAGLLNLDISLMWAVPTSDWSASRTDPSSPAAGSLRRPKFAQVLLAVPGSGSTAMCFLSSPLHPKTNWAASQLPTSTCREIGIAHIDEATAQRRALLDYACAALSKDPRFSGRPVLLQTLLDPPAPELCTAYSSAGFTRLGDLAYVRLPWGSESAAWTHAHPAKDLPPGVRMTSISQLQLDSAQIDRLLIQALEDSYQQTLDCPELCGLRDIRDVLDSHKSVGIHDPRLWWIIFAHNTPRGCLLLNQNPESDSVELVYLGVGPALRGKNLGMLLMCRALNALHEFFSASQRTAQRRSDDPPAPSCITCAVDTRNIPALKVYERLGFEHVGARIPFVKSIPPTLA